MFRPSDLFQKTTSLLKEQKEAILFFGKMLGIYIVVKGFYDYFLSPYTALDKNLIGLIINQAESLLRMLNYNLIDGTNSIYINHMGVEGSSGVVIGNPCDGLSLFILYASFILVFKGKWFVKLIAISTGILLLHLLNVLRVFSLALIVVYSPETLDFHHKYTFTLFVYLCIFLLWYFRIRWYKKRAQ